MQIREGKRISVSSLTLVIGNKNYSTWSLRPWLALRHAGIPFTERLIPLSDENWDEAITGVSPSRRIKSPGSWPKRRSNEDARIVGMSDRSVSTGDGLIRACAQDEFSRIQFIINEAAAAYRGVIPDDRWHEPYMSEEELEAEIAAGVRFLGWYARPDTLLGVMGAQDVQDVTLIRHAYVLSASQRGGIGSALIAALTQASARPLLVGTWKAATWAVTFYERHGFRRVSDTATLLRRYWNIPDRQIETSVVLADRRWFAAAGPGGAACAG